MRREYGCQVNENLPAKIDYDLILKSKPTKGTQYTLMRSVIHITLYMLEACRQP
jgi:hypothetical protein